MEHQSGHYLVAGPATLTIKRGTAYVLGYELKEGASITIPAGRKVPVSVEGSLAVTPGTAVLPSSGEDIKAFESAVEKMAEYKRILIVGPTDHGKSTLSAWAINRLLSAGREVAYMTTDVGQNEIFSPAFESIAKVMPPAIPGSRASFTIIDSCFIGSFSPVESLSAYLACASRLSSKAGEVIIDTDGWVRGEEAIRAKARLAVITRSELIVSLGLSQEEIEVLRRESGLEVLALPRLVRGEKSHAERKNHRDRLIAQGLLGSRPRLVASDLVEGLPLLRGKTVKTPFSNVIYSEELDGRIIAVYRGRAPALEGAVLLKEGWERGLLAAVHGEGVSIGVLDKIYYEKRLIRILTPYEGQITKIEVGRARVELDALGFMR